MTQSMTSGDIERMNAAYTRSGSQSSKSDSGHWIRFVLQEPGSCEGLRCAVHFADGSIEYGVFDSSNTVSFDRSSGSACRKVTLLNGSAAASQGSATEAILNAMLG